MAVKKEKDEEIVDLNDAATRKMLHDHKAMRNEALKAGLSTGLVSGLLGGIEAFFLIPEFVKKFKQGDAAGKFSERLVSTMKQNKLLTGLVITPAVVVGGAGMWGYFSAKSLLKKKEKELCALEQKEAQAAPPVTTKEVASDKPIDSGQPTWVDRTQSQNTAISPGR